MINLYAQHGTSNMGDFLNSLPVLSGIYNSYGAINLVIQDDMKRFNGFRDLLSYQPIFNSVKYKSEVSYYGDYIPFNSWVDDFSFDGVHPIETTRYKKYFDLTTVLSFDIDDTFILQVPHLNIDYYDIVVGDRCSSTANDNSRQYNILKSSNRFITANYLDFNNSCIFNANVIKQCNKFITTFTGVSVLADLMNIPFDLYYTRDFDGWAGQSIGLTYHKHFYITRKSTLKLLHD